MCIIRLIIHLLMFLRMLPIFMPSLGETIPPKIHYILWLTASREKAIMWERIWPGASITTGGGEKERSNFISIAIRSSLQLMEPAQKTIFVALTISKIKRRINTRNSLQHTQVYTRSSGLMACIALSIGLVCIDGTF